MSVHRSAVRELTAWQPSDPAAETLRQAFLAFLHARPDACQRDCPPGHLTASAAVLDHAGAQVLMTLHPRIGRWVQLGGHCEAGDDSVAAAALREATEESGIHGLTIDPDPVALHVHPITCSLGVPTRHLDLQFVVRAPAGAAITRSEESQDLRWWPVGALPPGSDHAVTSLVAAACARRRERSR